MRRNGTVGPIAQDELRAAVENEDLPPWAIERYETFREQLLGDRDGAPFPCHFGVESEARGMALYAVCGSSTDERALSGLRDVLVEYVDRFEDHAERTSLVTFFGPPDADAATTEAGYFERFWHVLQFLHDRDPVPWPPRIPTDPDDVYWEFCFAGEPIFPTARAPFYDARRSRYTPHGLEITFQPRTIFEGITGDTDAGKRARETIRDRMDEYDAVCPHADIGDWGESHEWKQYLLPEHNGDSHAACPIEITALRGADTTRKTDARRTSNSERGTDV